MLNQPKRSQVRLIAQLAGAARHARDLLLDGVRGDIAGEPRPAAPVLAVVLALAAAGFASAATAPAAGPTLKATLTGAAEKPTPGDPKGSGKATLHVDTPGDQVCYELQVKGVATVTMAHIHQAPPGESGPPLADLKAPGPDGKSSGCVPAGPVLLKGLTDNPSAYYVNVHNAQYPGGALRGQLHR